MKPFSFAIQATVALIAPLLFILGGELLGTGPLLERLQYVPLNWLYMAAPQLLVVLVGASLPSWRRFVGWPLLLLTLVLVGFTAWVHGFVPANESGLAWVFYLPLALAVVVTYMVVKFIWYDFHRDVHISDGG
ncbi:MAG: hypothetical protein EOP39_25580 [Rubrivivax sp.]|nr:MAG: hypothetical protein EOP39_25580 [Rubrivivax sp.]